MLKGKEIPSGSRYNKLMEMPKVKKVKVKVLNIKNREQIKEAIINKLV